MATVGTAGAISQPPTTIGHLGQGVTYPLTVERGRLKLSWGQQSVQEALQSMTDTQKRERPMLPGYGVGELLFEPIDPAIIQAELQEQIRLFEPRIEGAKVQVAFGQQVGEIAVQVTYKIRGEATPRTLTFPYFAGPA